MSGYKATVRERFNSGFHDGVIDVERGFHKKGRFGVPMNDFLNSHFDQVYAAGVRAGIAAAKSKKDCTLSDAAWAEYISQKA